MEQSHLVVEIADNSETSRATIDLPQADASHRAGFIAGLGIDILICSAISHQFDRMLIALGISTRPWFRGDVDEIISAHLNGILQNDNFLMPGCGRRRFQGRGRGCRRGNNPEKRQPYKEE